jgi:hypothetical protein
VASITPTHAFALIHHHAQIVKVVLDVSLFSCQRATSEDEKSRLKAAVGLHRKIWLTADAYQC